VEALYKAHISINHVFHQESLSSVGERRMAGRRTWKRMAQALAWLATDAPAVELDALTGEEAKVD
jgi:hypothetical protein